MAQLDARNVVGDCSLTLGDGGHLVRGNIEEFGVLVDEAPDEPGAGDAIDLGVFTSNPFHKASAWFSVMVMLIRDITQIILIGDITQILYVDGYPNNDP